MSGTHFLAVLGATRRDRIFSRDMRASHGRRRAGNPIRHVLFDLGGVLYDDSAWRRWLLHLLAHMGLHTHYASFFRVWDREFQTDVWRGNRDFWSALKQFLVAAGLSHGQVDEVEAASRARFRQFDHDIRPFPSVAATLDRITQSGSTVTIVSQEPLTAKQSAARLSRLGLADRIQEVVCTAAAASDGPDAFGWLHQQGRLVADESAYVGRDPRQLAAAARQRLLTVAFNCDDDAEADVYIEQFDQLLDVLELPGTRMLAAG